MEKNNKPTVIRDGELILNETEAILDKKYKLLGKGHILDEYLMLSEHATMSETLFCGLLLDVECCVGADYHRCIGINNHATDHTTICYHCGKKSTVRHSSLSFTCKKIISAIIIHSHSQTYYDFTASQITLLSNEPKSKVRFHFKKYERETIIRPNYGNIDMRKKYFLLDVIIDDWGYANLLNGFGVTEKLASYLMRPFIPINEKIKVMQHYDLTIHKLEGAATIGV